jgi:hypothetical protein
MRFIIISFLFLITACTQPKQTTSITEAVDTRIVDSIISIVIPRQLTVHETLNWANLVSLLESLSDMPSEQREVALKNIKDEAVSLANQPWPERFNSNPIRSRFNVFVTYASLAADQRFSVNPALEQARAIVKMKQSWNDFANRIENSLELPVLNTAVR